MMYGSSKHAATELLLFMITFVVVGRSKKLPKDRNAVILKAPGERAMRSLFQKVPGFVSSELTVNHGIN